MDNHDRRRRLSCVAAAAVLAAVGCTSPKPTAAPPPSVSVAAPSAVASAGKGPVEPTATGPSTPAPLWSRPGYERPKIIDFHGHLSVYGVDRIGRVLADVGIDRVLNLSGGSGRGGGRQWIVNRVLSERFDGRILNAMNISWRGFGRPGWAEQEVARLRSAVRQQGFVALKISKALGLGATTPEGALVMPDDPRLKPVWAEAARLGVPVCIHVADPKAFWADPGPSNERHAELAAHPGWSYFNKEGVASWSALLDASERLFKANPKTTFVAVHFGNAAEELDRVDRMLKTLPNMWIDVSARVGEFGRHPSAKMRAFFIQHQDRVLFGTDIGISDSYLMLGSNGEVQPTMADVRPFYEAHFRYFEGKGKQIAHPSPIQGAWRVDAIHLPANVLNKLYRENALRLLKRGRDLRAALPKMDAATTSP